MKIAELAVSFVPVADASRVGHASPKQTFRVRIFDLFCEFQRMSLAFSVDDRGPDCAADRMLEESDPSTQRCKGSKSRLTTSKGCNDNSDKFGNRATL